MRLYNSYVKHYQLFGCGKRWVEGRDNDIRGVLRNGRFRVRLTNSFGDKTTIVGREFRVWRLRVLRGTAYGYVHRPEGLSYVGFSWAAKQREYMILPAAWHKFLFVTLDKEV